MTKRYWRFQTVQCIATLLDMLRIVPPLIFVLLAPAVFAAPPDKLERERLIAHFEMTENWLADEVANLSPEQFRYRPAPAAWNTLDCVEHLVVAENEYWAMLQQTMAKPASKKLSPSTDLDRIWYGIDRTERTKTVPSETPKSTFADVAAALAKFKEQRAMILNYVRTSQDDWRHHQVEAWDRDAYQWLLMISAHSQRHILQVREIKHSPGFPQR